MLYWGNMEIGVDSSQSLNNVHEPRNAEFTVLLGSFYVV